VTILETRRRQAASSCSLASGHTALASADKGLWRAKEMTWPTRPISANRRSASSAQTQPIRTMSAASPRRARASSRTCRWCVNTID
jgi:hypothetical protein